VLDGSEISTIALLGDLANLTKSGNSPGNNAASLGVTNGRLDLDETGKKLGDERSDGNVRVDELGHVVDNNSDLTLGSGKLLAQTTRQEGNHERKGGGVYFRNECGSREELNSIRNLFDGINESLNKSRNKAFNVLVGNQSTSLLKGIPGSILDVLLRVPDSLGEDGDNVGHELGGLDGGALDELVESDDGARLDLPLAGSFDFVKEGGENQGGSPGVHISDIRPDGLDSSCPDSGHLVGKCLEKGVVDSGVDENGLESLDRWGGSEASDGAGSALTSSGRFFVGKSLDDGIGESSSLEGRGTLLFGGGSENSDSRLAGSFVSDKERWDVNLAINGSNGLEGGGGGDSSGGGDSRHVYRNDRKMYEFFR
jgi:hypothetical protein